MIEIPPNSELWSYLTQEQKVLIGDGMFLLNDSLNHKNEDPTDYSYLVFPFSKMYEGFLKQLFRDTEVISENDYWSDHFRLGKALSPTMAGRLGDRSAYRIICNKYNKPLAEELWETWKIARNQVFHYFPHNYKALTRTQAQELIEKIINAMVNSVHITKVLKKDERKD